MLSAMPEVGGIVAILAPTGEADAAGVAALVACLPGLKLPLLACVDVDYRGEGAVAAAIVFLDWTSPFALEEHVVTIDAVAGGNSMANANGSAFSRHTPSCPRIWYL